MVLSVPITEPFFTKGGWGPHWNNPWQDGPKNAPFDQEFYLIINLAVGGTNGYFPEGNGKHWSNAHTHTRHVHYTPHTPTPHTQASLGLTLTLML